MIKSYIIQMNEIVINTIHASLERHVYSKQVLRRDEATTLNEEGAE